MITDVNAGTRISYHFPPKIPARSKLKLLVLEADEETLARIMDAIRIVYSMADGSSLPQ